jgi:formylglycine-generating enzyme required for sulfatase activity
VNLRFLTLIVLLAVVAQPALPQEANAPLGKDQVLDLVKYGMDSAELAKRIKEHGIDFEPSEEYLEILRKAGAQEAVIRALREARPNPLTRDQVGELVAGGVPSERAAMLVKQHGVDFVADERYLQTLRLAGAEETLITALREASKAAVGELAVTTSPDAELLLDGAPQGRADAHGELVVKAGPGAHALKVSLAGKKDFEQSVTVVARQSTKVDVPLADMAGSIRVQTSAGAEVFLDDSSGGTADAGGKLLLPNVAPGSHELRVSAAGRKEFRQSVTVLAGKETSLEARLENLGPTPRQVQKNAKDGLNYVWIPPGTFVMGCSPGDSECGENEKPAHRVTLTKGFWIGQTPVTIGAYRRFATASGKKIPAFTHFPQGAAYANKSWVNDNMPMAYVSWEEAQAYCGWMGGRLPTEAEWEYAARGGDPQGRYGPIDDIAWYKGNSGGHEHEVAQKLPNGFGLYDMLGNVYEYVNDWYDSHYYQNSPPEDPPGSGRGRSSVVRGGAWDEGARYIRVSFRFWYNTTLSFNYGYGFRCAGETFKP